MKTTVLISVVVLSCILIESCNHDDNMSWSQSPNSSDLIALDGMVESYENARIYNDSLVFCKDSNIVCSQEFTVYCDSAFHAFADKYAVHHSKYSHGNGSDDHHHANTGLSMHNYGGTLSHNLSSFEMMQRLMLNHEAVHID